MALNAPYTANTVIQSDQVSDDLIGLSDGTNDTDGNKLSKFRDESFFDHVVSGLVWTGDSLGVNRNASMSSGVIIIDGIRAAVSAVSARTFTASKDTYIDINSSGTITYTEVSNNAASPALAASNMRIGIIVTGATTIANAGSINQGEETKVLPIASSNAYAVTDSLGNLICPRDPNRKLLGYRQIVAGTGALAWSTSDVDLTGVATPVIVPSGARKITIKAYGSDYNATGAIDTGYAVMKIKESTTILQRHNLVPSAANLPNAWYLEIPVTPSAGSHTYKIAIAHNTTGPNYTIGAGTDGPTLIRVGLD